MTHLQAIDKAIEATQFNIILSSPIRFLHLNIYYRIRLWKLHHDKRILERKLHN